MFCYYVWKTRSKLWFAKTKTKKILLPPSHTKKVFNINKSICSKFAKKKTKNICHSSTIFIEMFIVFFKQNGKSCFNFSITTTMNKWTNITRKIRMYFPLFFFILYLFLVKNTHFTIIHYTFVHPENLTLISMFIQLVV